MTFVRDTEALLAKEKDPAKITVDAGQLASYLSRIHRFVLSPRLIISHVAARPRRSCRSGFFFFTAVNAFLVSSVGRIQTLIRTFAKDWKKTIEEMDSDIMRSFTNFKVPKRYHNPLIT